MTLLSSLTQTIQVIGVGEDSSSSLSNIEGAFRLVTGNETSIANLQTISAVLSALGVLRELMEFGVNAGLC